MRGVTPVFGRKGEDSIISTRTPHAGSDEAHALFPGGGRISTRTPHAGSDLRGQHRYLAIVFQPALPMRGVTASPVFCTCSVPISTRTPHAGSDDDALHRDRAR